MPVLGRDRWKGATVDGKFGAERIHIVDLEYNIT